MSSNGIISASDLLEDHLISVDKTALKRGHYFVMKAAMIEFAELHVQAALKAASGQAELDYGEGSCRECGSNKIDEKSILNAYPNSNIK